MSADRIVGFGILGSVLLFAGLLGAPAEMLALIAGITLLTTVLPRGVGAQAASNLARRLYDRDAWKAHWSDHYLDRPAPDRIGRPSPRSTVHIPPDLLPGGIEESKAWLRTLGAIRRLPERRSSGKPPRG